MIFRFSDFELDEELFELRRGSARVAVQPKVMALLFVLVKHADRVVTKQEIFDDLWPDVTVSEASLSRAVMEARKAIDDEAQEKIVTVRGRGFRFAAPVEGRAPSMMPPAPHAPAPGAPATSQPPPRDPGAKLTGRSAAGAALLARLGDANAGRGGVAWVRGEPGIGKTRLVEDLSASAREAGFRVLWARCQRTEGAPPLWPFVQLARAHDEIAGDEPWVPAVAAVTATDDPAARFDALDALARLVVRSARDAALLLVVDDVADADPTSLRALALLLGMLHEGRALVVATYRELPPQDDPRRTALATLLGEHPGLSVPLYGLAREDVARLVEHTLGRAPSDGLLDAVVAKAGGNPRYVQRLLTADWVERVEAEGRATVGTSTALEGALLASITQHLETCTEACRELLTTASVLGHAVDVATLAAVAGVPAGQVLDPLEEATRARVLTKAGPSTYRFTHAVIRDVLYKRLLPGTRVERHAAAADALAKHYGAARELHAAELARHLVLAAPAGRAAEAAAACLVAARVASERGERDAALAHAEAAIGVLAYAPDARELRGRAQLALAEARGARGDHEAARRDYLDAVILARAFRDPDTLAEGALGFAARGDDPARVELLREADAALAAAGRDRADAKRARVAAALGETSA